MTLKTKRNNLSYVNSVNFSRPSCEKEQFTVRWIVEFLIEGCKISPIIIEKINALNAFFVLWKLTYIVWGLRKLCTIKTNNSNSNIFRNNNSNSFFMSIHIIQILSIILANFISWVGDSITHLTIRKMHLQSQQAIH